MNEAEKKAVGVECHLQEVTPFIYSAAITVPKTLVTKIYHEAARAHQKSVIAPGFAVGHAPLAYIEQNFKSTLIQHAQEFLYKYIVTSGLQRELRTAKLVTGGQPRLQTVYLQPNEDARFVFEVTVFPSLELHEWKYFPFKAPKRKKYKDLDRQVESFIDEEKQNLSKHSHNQANIGDWVSFNLYLVDEDNAPLLDHHKESMWLKMGDEEADSSLRELFLGKQAGDTFCSQSKGLQEYFSGLDTQSRFCITITDIVHNSYFCLESFKKYFKLKTNKEVYQKLIEVFSYRNDLSQRRSMVEEAFKLLLSKHRFTVPNHLVLRQQKEVLHAIQENPDYHVYRMQKDFKDRVRQLAEKQAKEALIIDHIAYQEGIVASDQDIRTYLNLAKRPRTKEFIYFTPPASKMRSQEMPLSTEELRIVCTREKTLNHIIYHLTQK